MDKKNYYEIELKNLQNGYLVTARYRKHSDSSEFTWEYERHEFAFTSWDQVIEFVKNNELEVPPKQV